MDLIASVLLVGAATALFVGIALAVVVVVTTSFSRIGVAKGLSAIDKVYSAGAASPAEEAFGDRVVTPLAKGMMRIGRALTPAGTVSRLRRWLDYAGNPPYWTVERVYEVKGIGLIVVGAVGTVIGLFFEGVGPGPLIGAAVGAVLGFYLPDLIIYEIGHHRQEAIRRSLPDVLDTLTVSVEAGLGFDAAIAQVTQHGQGPVPGEFARTLQEMQIGMSRAAAMRALAKRTSVTELRTFCAVVVQATELGIPIANVLREQAREMRIRRRQRAEELAQKVPVKILFPLVFCLLPALFIVVIGPGVLNILRSGIL
ncbi:MAG TPA: type II secretion system F family protein [Micromonosporaceae bacterium]